MTSNSYGFSARIVSRMPMGIAFAAASCLVGCFSIEGIPVDPDAGPVVTPDVEVLPDVVVPPVREPFALGQNIRDIEVDTTRVYWVEYGTLDGLGNPNDDGKLRARTRAGGPIETLATGLAGPVSVFVTSTHAYVCLDAAPQPGGTRASMMMRVPLAGGAASPLHVTAACPQAFVAVGDRAFWGDGRTIRTMAPDDIAAGSFLTLPEGTNVVQMRVLAADLYFSSYVVYPGTYIPVGAPLQSVPLAGGTPAVVGNYPADIFDLYQGQLIGVEDLQSEVYLTRANLGDVRERFALIAKSSSWNDYVEALDVVGDSLVLSVPRFGNGYDSFIEILRLPFAAPTEQVSVATWSKNASYFYTRPATATNPDAVYWAPDPTRIDTESW